MRLLTIIIGCLAVGSCLGQDQLVLTRLLQSDTIEIDDTLHLDLENYFQFFEPTGPVATFVIDMPVLDDREIDVVIYGNSTKIVAYKMKDGSTYNNPYAVGGEDYVWEQHLVEFRLLPEQAPFTVANFMTYVAEGAYVNTIVHRNESTGSVFKPQDVPGIGFAGQEFVPFPIIQAGAYRLYTEEEYILHAIETAPPIVFEESGTLDQGTLAMARSETLDSATSQFFVNLQDNSSIVEDPFAVFGELIDPNSDFPILMDFANTPVYDLSSPYTLGAANLFPNLPFESIPLYAPYPYEKESYARISSITISEGNPEGVHYAYEWVIAGEEPTQDERDNQSVFDVVLQGATLKVSRHNTGKATIRIIGASEDGQIAQFEISLTAYNQKGLDLFPASEVHFEGWMENDWYGWLVADSFPNLYHQNHGNQIVADHSTADALFLYDLGLASWIYTGPAIYPLIFDYHLNSWIWYQLGSGSYDSQRWFYLYDVENPRWVVESEISNQSGGLTPSIEPLP